MTLHRFRVPGEYPSIAIDPTIDTHLGRLLAVLHDRGVLNETALVAVLEQLADRPVLTVDHLVAIFGVAPIFHLLTIPDETARTLVKEAADAMFNPDSPVNLEQWLKAATAIVGPVKMPARAYDVAPIDPRD